MIFHENRLLAGDSREISYLIFSKIGKDVAKLSAAVVIGTLRVNSQSLYTGVFLFLVGYNNLGMVDFTYQGVKG